MHQLHVSITIVYHYVHVRVHIDTGGDVEKFAKVLMYLQGMQPTSTTRFCLSNLISSCVGRNADGDMEARVRPEPELGLG